METLERIRLEPVLELEPGRYSTTERKSPEKYGDEAPEEWEKYWRESLSDSGLGHLANLRPGSWQVPVRLLLEEAPLEKIMSVELRPYEDQGESLSVEWDPVLKGGIALLAGERPVIQAQCCGDLGNHVYWAAAARHTDACWTRYWIGHPQLPVRFADGWLELGKPNDDRTPEALWRVWPESLLQSVAGARAELERFVPRIRQVLGKWPVKGDIHGLALNLAGLRAE